MGGSMADFDTGDIVRLAAVQKYATVTDIVGVLHLKINAGGGLAFAAAAQDFVEYCDALYDTIKTLVPTNQIDDHISIQNITQDQVWGNVAWGTYTGGTSAGIPCAAQTALLVWGRTSLSRVQIRKYLGVITQPNLVSGVWTAGSRAIAQNFINYHIVAQTMTNGLVLQGGAYSPTLARFTTAVSGTTSQVPCTVRRRRIGRGS
jgi:hypothetical protein